MGVLELVVLLGLGQSTASARPGDRVRTGRFAESRAVGSEVRVLDWNIARGRRLGPVIATIQRLRPDICLLQEVDLNAARTGRRDIAVELAKALRMNYVFAAAFEELGQGTPEQPATQGQAILTTLPVRSSRVLRYQRQTRFWQPHRLVPNVGVLQRRLGGRIALVAELGQGGTQLVVYNLHLESRGPGAARMGQLREVLADARRYGPGVTVLVGGDLNTKYRPGLFESKLTLEGFRNCFGPRHERTHVLYGALDWMFLRGKSTCSDAEVVRGSKASDHDPLLLRIQFSADEK